MYYTAVDWALGAVVVCAGGGTEYEPLLVFVDGTCIDRGSLKLYVLRNMRNTAVVGIALIVFCATPGLKRSATCYVVRTWVLRGNDECSSQVIFSPCRALLRRRNFFFFSSSSLPFFMHHIIAARTVER